MTSHEQLCGHNWPQGHAVCTLQRGHDGHHGNGSCYWSNDVGGYSVPAPVSSNLRPLTERLRSGFGGLVPPICDEAANEIELLRAALEKVRPYSGAATREIIDEALAGDSSAPTSNEQNFTLANRIGDQVVQNVCELPGYTSPDNQPELLACTVAELHSAVVNAIEAIAPALLSNPHSAPETSAPLRLAASLDAPWPLTVVLEKLIEIAQIAERTADYPGRDSINIAIQCGHGCLNNLRAALEQKGAQETESHRHTNECWEPDSGCDMGRNEKFAEKASAEHHPFPLTITPIPKKTIARCRCGAHDWPTGIVQIEDSCGRLHTLRGCQSEVVQKAGEEP